MKQIADHGAGALTIAVSRPSVPLAGLPEHLPSQFRSLFALAKCWQIYTLDGEQGLPRGGGPWLPSLEVVSVLH